MSLSADSIRPRGVTLDKQKHELRVDWGPGHVGIYPLDALREACPCVVCRGGHDMMGQEHDPYLIELKPARSYRVTDAQMVGNYAIQFWWDDGHDSGIYSWEYLYRICPCPDCEARRRGPA